MKSPCAVCSSETVPLFRKRVLERYDVAYYRCSRCKLVQTEAPYWLEEAYDDAISALDTGLVARAASLAPKVEALIRLIAPLEGRFLDYGGGSGLFVRMMRDRGFQFFRDDPHAKAIFSRHFDLEDLPSHERRFELVTAFEVLEHLPRPVETLTQVFRLTDTMLLSTDLVPSLEPETLSSWWYLGAAHGQHVCFHGVESMNALAGRLGCRYVQLEPTLHLITRVPDLPKKLEGPPDARLMAALTWPDSLIAAERKRTAPVSRVERALTRLRKRASTLVKLLP